MDTLGRHLVYHFNIRLRCWPYRRLATGFGKRNRKRMAQMRLGIKASHELPYRRQARMTLTSNRPASRPVLHSV